MVKECNHDLSPGNNLNEVDSQIAETNRYLIELEENPVSDPRAIEMVKRTGQYAKSRGAPVPDYVLSGYDTNQLTKLLAKGASEEELTKFYEDPIKSKMDLDVKDYNSLGMVELNNYNINLKKFFELPTEKKVSYLSKLKNFGKKAIPVALAASLLAAPVAAFYDQPQINNLFFLQKYNKTNYIYDFDDILNRYDDFNEIYKSLDEPIIPPDEIIKMLEDDNKMIDISKPDLAILLAICSEETSAVSPYVICVDTNGNKKPDTLFAMYSSQRKGGELTSAVEVPEKYYGLNGKRILFISNPDYLINPFDTLGPDDSNIVNLLHFNNPSMINFGDKPTIIHWEDAVGKTLDELGLDEYEVKNRGLDIKEETPGFGSIAVLGAGAAAYLGKKYRKRN